MKYFIIIDMQNDFVDGALANPAAKAIIPAIAEKAKEMKALGYKVIATRDTHYDNYMETQEGKNLPVPHCIKDSKGWEVVDELKPFVDLYVDKESFGYSEWVSQDPYSDSMKFLGGLNFVESAKEENFKSIWKKEKSYTTFEPEEIAMCGTCTGICVSSNFTILKTSYPEVPITVYKDLCACVTPESHEAAIKTMQMQQAIIK